MTQTTPNRRHAGTERSRPSLSRSSRPDRARPRAAWSPSSPCRIVVLGWTAHGTGLAAPLSQDTVLTITYPSPGSVLSGQVPIQGTATHPGFVSYGLLYRDRHREVTGATSWQHNSPIAWDVRTMVVNNVLGTWDTTRSPQWHTYLPLRCIKLATTPRLFLREQPDGQQRGATPTRSPPRPQRSPAEEPANRKDLARHRQRRRSFSRPRPLPRPGSAAPEVAATDEDGGDEDGGNLAR